MPLRCGKGSLAAATPTSNGAASGQLLYTMLLRRGEASVVSAWMFSVPITAAVLAVVLLGEPLRLPLVIGLVLVSVGVRLATQRTGRGVTSAT